MCATRFCWAWALPLLMVGLAQAQPGEEPARERGPRNPEMREQMLKEFDADGDGKLNDEERQQAREVMRERRGGPGQQADRPGRGQGRGQGRGEGRGEGRAEGRGPGRGPGAGEGRPGRRPAERPDPNALFDRFDANGDGQLSREEFLKLSEAMPPRRGEGRPGAGPGGPGGPGGRQADRGPREDRAPREGRGPRADGPPGEPGERPRRPRRPAADEERWSSPPGEDSPRPLGNQFDDPAGPPPGRGFGRGQGRGPGAGRGPGGGPGSGPGGGPGMDPNRLFDRFDANGDDQLSREEFAQLTEQVREMRGQMRERWQEGRGGRGGFGPPPPRGAGPPPRPEFDEEMPPEMDE